MEKNERYKVNNLVIYQKRNADFIKGSILFDLAYNDFEKVLRALKGEESKSSEESKSRDWSMPIRHTRSPKADQFQDENEKEKELLYLDTKMQSFTIDQMQSYIESFPSGAYYFKGLQRKFLGQTIKSTGDTMSIFKTFQSRVRVAKLRIQEKTGKHYAFKKLEYQGKLRRIHVLDLNVNLSPEILSVLLRGEEYQTVKELVAKMEQLRN